jgi:deoxyxylulose-5-phosphate synthase
MQGEYVGEIGEGGQEHGEQMFRLFEKHSDKLIVTYGRLVNEALARDSDVLQLLRIKPLPEDAITTVMKYTDVVFWEEGSERGGIGEALLLELTRRSWQKNRETSYDIKAVTDFVPAAEVDVQLRRIVS